MALPAHGNQGNPASGSSTRRLLKGELLFAEGESSKAMYLLKSGMLRLFKKKGGNPIELDVVRSGQIIGELAFLDGEPRSASAEALTDCELMEVSLPMFQQVMVKLPDWLKILLKTIVGRLRTSSTRIRQLETVSTSIDYNEKDGKRSTHYIYLSVIEILKISTGVLLVASRNGKTAEGGLEVRTALVQRYCNQVMGVPVAKITTFLDTLAQLGLATVGAEGDSKFILKDIDFLEAFIAYLNEENLLEASKRHDLTPGGYLAMSLIAKNALTLAPDAEGIATANLATIRNPSGLEGGKEMFRLEDFEELVRLGYATAPNLKSRTEIFTSIEVDSFIKAHKFQRVVLVIQAVNEQKSKGTK